MPIVKCKDYIDVYRHKASAQDALELSGRPGRGDLTDFINATIASHVATPHDGILVDIGCGDGSLLRLLSGRIAQGVGILPTEQELQRVGAISGDFSNIRFSTGLSRATGLPSGFADTVVCNGVLILVPDPDIDASLAEMARITKAGGTVFIGEVPDRNEFEGKNYGDSILGWLWWVLRRQGVAAFLARLRQVVVAMASSEPLIIAPKVHFHARPEAFLGRAEAFGLVCASHFRHRELDATGAESTSKSRWDYLFRKH